MSEELEFCEQCGSKSRYLVLVYDRDLHKESQGMVSPQEFFCLKCLSEAMQGEVQGEQEHE